jgi:hypothetical protein
MTIKLTKSCAPGGVPAHEYRAIESLSEFRSLAQPADLIWAVDLSTRNNQAIVFGQAALERIVTTGEKQALKVLAFAIDFRTDQVEHLLAAVSVVKGQFEWNGIVHTASGPAEHA